jgi:hypothetical protein
MRRIALAVLAILAVQGTAFASSSDDYTNSSGHRVRPVHSNQVPPSATARFRDGTYSFSEHHRGACSHRGGVALWL